TPILFMVVSSARRVFERVERGGFCRSRSPAPRLDRPHLIHPWSRNLASICLATSVTIWLILPSTLLLPLSSPYPFTPVVTRRPMGLPVARATPAGAAARGGLLAPGAPVPHTR